MTNPMPTYAVMMHREFLGYVNGVSYLQALGRARRQHGAYVDVELALNVKPRAVDRREANLEYNAKHTYTYPTPGFEERRAALIAEFKANA